MKSYAYKTKAARRLSVIVAARNPWPAVRACLDALRPQVAQSDAELIVAVSGAEVKPPPAEDRYPGIVWVLQPGGSVFSLRAAALAEAHGDIVAITEDHAWVAPDWCSRILDAHQAYPEAVAIGGVIENVATGALLDWASFFIAGGRFMAPIEDGVTDTISLQANVSYKRRALPADLPSLGMMQLTFNTDLAKSGQMMCADGRIVVYHDQTLTWREHSAAHFHNGRSIAAFRLPGMSAGMRVLRSMGCVILPGVMLWRTLRQVGGKRRHTRELIESTPWIVWLLCCHAAGEFLGYSSGPSDSPWRVQ